MPIDPHTLMHRWFNEVWNQGNEATVDELFAPNGIGHGLGEEADVRSPGEFKAFLRNMRSAIPDVSIRILDTIVEGDKAVTRLVLAGTHKGEGLGLPATGRSVSISGIVIARVVGGQIVEAWNNWDQLGLLKQLGAIPSSKAPDRFLSAKA